MKVEEQVWQVARHKPRWFLYKIVKIGLQPTTNAKSLVARTVQCAFGHSALEDQVQLNPLHP